MQKKMLLMQMLRLLMLRYRPLPLVQAEVLPDVLVIFH